LVPTEKNFTSWLGLCPQHQSSAGKIRSRRVRPGMNRAGRALRLAVQGCYNAQHVLGALGSRVAQKDEDAEVREAAAAAVKAIDPQAGLTRGSR
jgi:Transposase IS116/IS110/IS902 family